MSLKNDLAGEIAEMRRARFSNKQIADAILPLVIERLAASLDRLAQHRDGGDYAKAAALIREQGNQS